MLSTPNLAILKDRARLLQEARSFFSMRQILEVDCPIISAAASVDAHIDLIPVLEANHTVRYLHSSPEYGMKRLLAQGIGDIYQLSHVFRQGEYGPKHNPEFMMAEWYRLGFSFEALIQETIQFIVLFLGNLPHEILSYRQALLKFTGLDYLKVSTQDLETYLADKKIDCPLSSLEKTKDNLLNLILGILVEPYLGQDKLTVLAYYPASQAALAQTQWHREEKVAERFEIYFKGLELCNGYHELTHATEQRQRLMEANQLREDLGKERLPLDENFLQALELGLPDCCGVAVGFDRLMLLRHHASNLSQVLPFAWTLA